MVNSNDVNRPITSKARGICKYYNVSRGCFAGDKCKFLHGPTERLTQYDKAKTCRYFAAGFCKHGDKCWFIHTMPEADVESADVCAICLEKPATYALLSCCTHTFCIECIRKWRDPTDKPEEVVSSGSIKRCPLCQTEAKLTIPSSHFYPHDSLGKAEAKRRYIESMAKVPCLYFQATKTTRPFCPFGRDCFYQHRKDDGTLHVFPHGVKVYIKHRSRRATMGDAGIGGPRFGQPQFRAVVDFVTNVFHPMIRLNELNATIDAIRSRLPQLMRRMAFDEEEAQDQATNFDATEDGGPRADNVVEDGGSEDYSPTSFDTDQLMNPILNYLLPLRSASPSNAGSEEENSAYGTASTSVPGAAYQSGQSEDVDDRLLSAATPMFPVIHTGTEFDDGRALVSSGAVAETLEQPYRFDGTEAHHIYEFGFSDGLSSPLSTSMTSESPQPTVLLPATSRFSTVVGNRDRRLIISLDDTDEDDGDEGENEEDDGASVDNDIDLPNANFDLPSLPSSVPDHTSSPAFGCDTTADIPSSSPPSPEPANSRAVRWSAPSSPRERHSSILSPMDASSADIDPEPPFVTDGRGRVVWTSPCVSTTSLPARGGVGTTRRK